MACNTWKVRLGRWSWLGDMLKYLYKRSKYLTFLTAMKNRVYNISYDVRILSLFSVLFFRPTLHGDKWSISYNFEENPNIIKSFLNFEDLAFRNGNEATSVFTSAASPADQFFTKARSN